MGFLLFAFIIILCSAGGSIYVGWRSARALFKKRWQRHLWQALILSLSLLFFVSMALRDTRFAEFFAVLRIVGTAWLISLPYWLIAATVFHIIAWIHRSRSVFPQWVSRNPLCAGRVACLACFLTVAAIFVHGYWRFDNPVITQVSVTLKKTGGAAGFVRIAVVGDIVGKARLAKNVALLNFVQADMIVLVGDIIDRDPAILWKQNLHEEFQKLKAPLGVYAVLGNHEQIMGKEASASCTSFLEKHCGIRVLRDELVPVAGGRFYLAGRRDRQERLARRALADVVRGADTARPLIVLDHQPAGPSLREAAAAGAALQISGHTHGGQIWPASWVTSLLYKVNYGLGWQDDMAILVTSGLGLWGFPARIGTVSEVVDLRVQFGGVPQEKP